MVEFSRRQKAKKIAEFVNDENSQDFGVKIKIQLKFRLCHFNRPKSHENIFLGKKFKKTRWKWWK